MSKKEERLWPRPGMLIHNKKGGKTYTCGELLGEGGFARCYEVTDPTYKRFAAKIIQKACLASQKQKHKLFAEIKIHQMMSHSSIVKFYDVFEDENNVYMLLELCENKTLVEMLKARRRLTETEVRFFMWHLLDSVHYMHKNRVIHRDLKLGNLFLSADLKLKVGDFGLAAILRHDGERKNTICGTPNYIAPEVLFDSKKGHSFEVDLWSLGVIMYTLLIGKPPFQTKDVRAIYKNIKNNFYEFPSNIEISSESRSVIYSLLNSNPESRPSVEEVMASPFFSCHAVPDSLPLSALLPSAPSAQSLTVSTTSASQTRRASNTQPTTGQGQRLLRELSNSQQRKLESPTKITSSNDKSDGYGTAIASTPSKSATKTENLPPAPSPPPVPSEVRVSTIPREQEKSDSSSSLRNAKGNSMPIDYKQKGKRLLQLSDSSSSRNGKAHTVPTPEKGKGEDVVLFSVADRRGQSSLDAIYTNICLAFDNDESAASDWTPKFDKDTLPVFITKWIDYSNKYGLGYQLRDGTVGVYFKRFDNVMEYLSYESVGGNTKIRRRAFTLSTAPSELQKKITLLKHFGGYMQDNLFKVRSLFFLFADVIFIIKTADVADVDIAQSKENVYLTKYMKTRHGVVFRLSNRVFQLNFFDHTKLILCSDGRSVCYIDKSRSLQIMDTREAVQGGAGANPHQKEVVSRLQYAKEVIHQMILKKQKKARGDGVDG
ncbi:kinase-like domain-containing protein [Chytridium lagenaria]|nr:kinase-like domain-containing protein [Chytridium lagenaria]